MSKCVTVIAPVNIAVIKYWGKRDEDLILPLNDSVSATLDTSVMCAKTTVCARPDFTEDELWLNNERVPFSKRLENCLREIKARAAAEKTVSDEFLQWKIHACSENNFPTAAGLASSAAGFACFVKALALLYRLNSDISSIARLGSGSACRSVFGGFVRWHAGTQTDGLDSIATEIVNPKHWPEMRVLILVVGDSKKKTSSTGGMAISVQTSELLKYRVQYCVPQRTTEIIEAIKNKDFPRFAKITMKDSNQFHAICLDSFPPFVYMNDISHSIVALIHKYNEISNEVKVAYTFDAGPNACLYLLEKDVSEVISLIKYAYPPLDLKSYITGMPYKEETLNTKIQGICEPQREGLIKYVIHTKIGDGPSEVIDGSHLLNDVGCPINVRDQ